MFYGIKMYCSNMPLILQTYNLYSLQIRAFQNIGFYPCIQFSGIQLYQLDQYSPDQADNNNGEKLTTTPYHE